MFDDAMQTQFLDRNLFEPELLMAQAEETLAPTKWPKKQLLMESYDGRPTACWLRAAVRKTRIYTDIMKY